MYDDKYLKRVLSLLKRRYGRSPKTSLGHSDEWQLLVATMLSAQAQDRQVNKITKRLFEKYGSIKDFADLNPSQLYPYISSIGLYRVKAIFI